MAAAVRAALYLRVSTGRQADNDLSIPDQRRQAKAYCASRGWEIVADYVEPGASATDDRRPEFQRMIDAATAKPPAFDMIVVHSFSRFFRDQFQLEFYVRRLAKNGVRLVSITQELGDDPMSNMIRQIMALFDEYQSKENAKHTLRAMKENARQGFWNGALPPIGYRIVAGEQRGHRTKKTLEVDPIQAETVRLIFRLAREGNGSSGPMGVKSITKHLNEAGIRTRDGGRWGVDAVHKVLTRATYIGRHRFNTKFWKTRERKPETEVVEMAVPPIIDVAEFEAVQTLLKTRSPAMTAPRVVSGPTLLTGICFCAACGGAMTLRTGKSGKYRYYTCCTKARQGETGCKGHTIPMEKLDSVVAEHIAHRLLQPKRLEQILSHVLDRREERAERRIAHIAELRKRASEADAKLKRLYDAIENGVANLSDPMLKERVIELKAIRDQARADAERAEGVIDRLGPSITPQALKTFASQARRRMRTESGGYRRDHLRALAQRIEVDAKQVRIMGSKSVLLRTLVAASSAKTAGFGVPSFVPKWRARSDSNWRQAQRQAAGRGARKGRRMTTAFAPRQPAAPRGGNGDCHEAPCRPLARPGYVRDPCRWTGIDFGQIHHRDDFCLWLRICVCLVQPADDFDHRMMSVPQMNFTSQLHLSQEQGERHGGGRDELFHQIDKGRHVECLALFGGIRLRNFRPARAASCRREHRISLRPPSRNRNRHRRDTSAVARSAAE
jgi:DNA invertase Pin-like site-specific DNA recombinase